jgi:hypothetical protein
MPLRKITFWRKTFPCQRGSFYITLLPIDSQRIDE